MLVSILLGEGDLLSKIIYLLIYVIAIVISFSFHEWAHAHAAHKMGDDTARNMGRMTLNPIAHIDPAGFLMILLVGFGWAKPVPVNPRNYRNYRWGEFRVSFAGIFTNLIIALVSGLLYVALLTCEYMTGTMLPDLLFTFLYILGLLNCALAIFNLLPIYPLDGAHIFELLFGKLIGVKALNWIHSHGNILLIALFGISFVLSRFFGVSLVSDVAGWLFGKILLLFSRLASLIPGITNMVF